MTRDGLLKALQTVRGNQRVTSQNPEDTYQALERYGRDLTQLSRQRERAHVNVETYRKEH